MNNIIYSEEFTIQQNKYKSVCRTKILEHDNFKFFALFELKSKDAEKHLDEIFEALNFSFNKIFKTENLNLDNIENLFEKSIKDFNSYIQDLIELSNIQINLQNLNGLVGIILNNHIFITQRGNIKGLFLFKNKKAEYKLVDILKQEKKQINTNKIFNDIIKGQINQGQGFLFCTESVAKYLTDYQIKNILILNEATYNTISAHLKDLTNNENFAGIILKNIEIHPKIDLSQLQKNSQQSNHSISYLENTREKTQELLSPTILSKIKNLFKKQKNYKLNLDKVKYKNLIKNIIKYTKQFFFSFYKKMKFLLNLFQQKINIFPQKKYIEKPKEQIQNNLINNIKHKFILIKSKTKIILGIIIILIPIFIISTLYVKKNKIKIEQQKIYNDLKQQIQENLLKAETATIHQANNRAALHLAQAKKLYKKIKNSPLFIEEQNKLQFQQKIQQIDDKIKKIKRIQPKMIYDLSKNLENIKGFNLVKSQLYIYSKINPYLAILNLETKEITIINSKNKNISIQNFTIFSKKNNLPIFLDQSQDLYQLQLKQKIFKQIKYKKPNNFIKQIKTYGNNIYLLIPEENQIYKYRAYNLTNLSSPIKWIKDNSILDLSSAVDMYINGRIFVLLKNGNILQFSNGQKLQYNLENNIEPPIEQIKKFIYSENKKQFYLLEPENNRIIVFDIFGNFKYQYISQDLNNLQDIQYNDENSELLILNNNKIYKIQE